MGQPLTPEQRIAYMENLLHVQGVMLNELRQALEEQGIAIPTYDQGPKNGQA